MEYWKISKDLLQDRTAMTRFIIGPGIQLSCYLNRAFRQWVEYSEFMRGQPGRYWFQHANTPVLQHAGIWNKKD